MTTRPTSARDSLVVEELRLSLRSERGGVTPVDRVSFKVGPGERVAIVGESGSGKSMTVRSLLKLIPEAIIEEISGRATFGETELLGLQRSQLQRVRGQRIAMVFQDAMSYLNPTMRIGRQITEALRGCSDKELSDTRRRVLASVGLPDDEQLARRYPHELSGGMRQRVLLAIALAQSPKLLIADEPTTALDVTVQAQVLGTIRELTEVGDMSLLLITHDLAIVRSLCDRVYIMYAGQIVESGSVTEVFQRPQHPYTQALLDSVLTIDEAVDSELPTIRGRVPDFHNLPVGCRFAPRCPKRMDVCDVPPPMLEARPNRARCWLHEPEASSRAGEQSQAVTS